ncbi:MULTISPECIES: hypothetical protein [Clostridium]|uniref:Uncharacterized protein n=2 Tax=Clostridium TaxID=1485 RepID=A0A0E3JME1_CLOSL|nr:MULTISPECIES: hypothetical protein [Clostridium]AKA67942.1 hypothetical protein CSCA_0817 [Clostridium scatologenes]AWI05660.1 hypothetical protein B9W14_14495 [Clostridium drakei]
MSELTSCQKECIRVERDFYNKINKEIQNIDTEILNININIGNIVAEKNDATNNFDAAEKQAQLSPSKETQQALLDASERKKKADEEFKKIKDMQKKVEKLKEERMDKNEKLNNGFIKLIEKYRSCWEI